MNKSIIAIILCSILFIFFGIYLNIKNIMFIPDILLNNSYIFLLFNLLNLLFFINLFFIGYIIFKIGFEYSYIFILIYFSIPFVEIFNHTLNIYNFIYLYLLILGIINTIYLMHKYDRKPNYLSIKQQFLLIIHNFKLILFMFVINCLISYNIRIPIISSFIEIGLPQNSSLILCLFATFPLFFYIMNLLFQLLFNFKNILLVLISFDIYKIKKCFLSFDYSLNSVKLSMNKKNINKLLMFFVFIISLKYFFLILLPLILYEFKLFKFINLNSLSEVLLTKSQGIKPKHTLLSTFNFFFIGTITIIDYDNYNINAPIYEGMHPYFIQGKYNKNVTDIYEKSYLLKKGYIEDKEKGTFTYPHDHLINPGLYGGGPCYSLDDTHAGKFKYVGKVCTDFYKDFHKKYEINPDHYYKLLQYKKQDMLEDSFFKSVEDNLPTIDMVNFGKNYDLIAQYIKNLFNTYTNALHSIIDKPKGYYTDSKGFYLHHKDSLTGKDKIIAAIDITRNNQGFGSALFAFKNSLDNLSLAEGETLFGVNQIGEYISFFIYKPGFHFANGMERKVFCYRDILSLYVADQGVKVLPQGNTIHPQVRFYKFSNDGDKMCIHIILRFIASCSKVPNVIIENNELVLNNNDINKSKVLTALIQSKPDPLGIDCEGNIL